MYSYIILTNLYTLPSLIPSNTAGFMMLFNVLGVVSNLNSIHARCLASSVHMSQAISPPKINVANIGPSNKVVHS